jgi:hypothetical protein
MPAGTSTGPNDALTAAVFALIPKATVDTHLVVSSLQRVGVSFAGAQQFSQGQTVTNPSDRLVVAKMLSELLKYLATPR